ncbi:hypothetical protein [Leeia oryzae]|uniref:hypothetical protein n=1 Tax=Leeia oryzae TaxID=356662 RepID=UPI000377BDEA|nr:hypothetical protein [Leeia oryzae]
MFSKSAIGVIASAQDVKNTCQYGFAFLIYKQRLASIFVVLAALLERKLCREVLTMLAEVRIVRTSAADADDETKRLIAEFTKV